MTSPNPIESPPAALSSARRRQIATDFFTRNPGPGRRGLGLGQAVVEFIDWMIDSGRLEDHSGSPWWRTLNGRMVLDLDHPKPLWQAYTTTPAVDAQAALWRAHRASLDAAAAEGEPLLAGEPAAEQAFIRIVLDVVEQAATRGVRTDSDQLGETTRTLYPRDYPITPERLAALEDAIRRPPSRG